MVRVEVLMLVECPECGRRVSDRAASCPQCGFPIAAELSKSLSRKPNPADVSVGTPDAGRGGQPDPAVVTDDGARSSPAGVAAEREAINRSYKCPRASMLSLRDEHAMFRSLPGEQWLLEAQARLSVTVGGLPAGGAPGFVSVSNLRLVFEPAKTSITKRTLSILRNEIESVERGANLFVFPNALVIRTKDQQCIKLTTWSRNAIADLLVAEASAQVRDSASTSIARFAGTDGADVPGATGSAAGMQEEGSQMRLWIRLGVTLLCAPALLVWGFLGGALVMAPLLYKGDSAGMALSGLFALGVAAQAALAIWCAWGRRPGVGTRMTLLILSIGSAVVAVTMAAIPLRSDPAEVKALNAMMLLVAAGSGLAVVLLRRPRSGAQPGDQIFRLQQRPRAGDIIESAHHGELEVLGTDKGRCVVVDKFGKRRGFDYVVAPDGHAVRNGARPANH